MSPSRKPSASAGTRRSPRPRGTGSIQVRTNADGSQTFFAVVRHNGKPVWRKAGTTSKQAQRLLHELLAEQGKGDTARLEGGVAFGDYAAEWIARFERREKKPSTKEGYRRIVRKVLIPCLGRQPLHTIDRDEVQAVFDRRISGRAPDAARMTWEPVSVKTALNEVAVLRKLLNDARYQDGHNTRPGWRGLDTPEHTGRPRIFLRRHQIYALLGATPPEHEMMMQLLCYLGLRIGECIALRWSDFDEQRRTLLVERSWSHSRLVAPKTKAGKRTLPLSEQLATELVRHRPKPRQAATAQQLLYGFNRPQDGPPNELGLIFPSKTGGHLDPAHWRQSVFHPSAREARLPADTVPHSLRHSAAVAMLRAGLPMAQVRANLGHNTIGITMDLYARMDPGEFGTPADVMGRV